MCGLEQTRHRQKYSTLPHRQNLKQWTHSYKEGHSDYPGLETGNGEMMFGGFKDPGGVSYSLWKE